MESPIAIPFTETQARLIREKREQIVRLDASINTICELTVAEGGGDMAGQWAISPNGLGMEKRTPPESK